MSIQTGNKVTRGEKLLSAMASDGLISEAGKCWLECAVDPFHDHQLKRLDGWPDVQTGASVVRIVKQSVTIAVPTGVVGNWDCHIVQWPWLTATTSGTSVGCYTASAARNGQVITMTPVPTQYAPVGGLQAYYVQPGTPLQAVQLPTGGGTTQLIATMNVPTVFTKGVSRLIGMGFEVHNTTSTLNVQGAVLGWRQMANDNTNNTWNQFLAATPTITANYSGPSVRYPPVNSQEAMLLAGSRQWEAKDGIYSVSAFHTTENPAIAISPTCPVILSDAASDLEGTLSTSSVNYCLPIGVVGNSFTMPSFRVLNVHQSGAIFTGLSNSTTLTINWNVFIETFPGSDDQEILPLATPSAEFDPDVLDLYSRITVDLPVAVPVAENGLGDWFYDAASTAAKYLGPTLSLMPHPMLKAAGVALTGMSEVMEKSNKKTKKKKESRPVRLQSAAPPNSWGAPPLPKRSRINYAPSYGPPNKPKRGQSAPAKQQNGRERNGRSRSRR